MKTIMLSALTIACSLPALSQYYWGVSKKEPSKQHTVTVYYCTYTDGGDFSVDSGEVVVPEHLRSAYIDALSKRGKLYGTREQIIKRVTRNRYQVSSLRAVSVAAWDSLFTPPNRGGYNSASEAEDRTIQGAYWLRRYRITGTVVGLNGPFVVFKVQKSVRVADANYDEK